MELPWWIWSKFSIFFTSWKNTFLKLYCMSIKESISAELNNWLPVMKNFYLNVLYLLKE
jgi:hypothetical protein